MKKIQEELKKIKEFDGQTLKTKELVAAGLSHYDIKSYTEKGYLEKIDYGKYKIKIQEKEESINKEYILNLLKKFESLIKEKKYYDAYIVLKHICEDKIISDFDTNIYMYFRLLKNIPGPYYDYSYADDLKVDQESLEFYEKLILKGEIAKAKEKIEPLYQFALKTPQENNNNIIIIHTLVNALESNNVKTTELNNEQMRHYYQLFIKRCRERNHNAALSYLNKCINYCDNEKFVEQLKLMKIIVESVLNTLKTKEPACISGCDYTDTIDVHILFKESIEKHDFMYAFYIIEKYNLDAQKIYRIFSYLLRSLLRLTGEFKDYISFCENIQAKERKSEEAFPKDENSTECVEELKTPEVSVQVTPETCENVIKETYDEIGYETKEEDETKKVEEIPVVEEKNAHVPLVEKTKPDKLEYGYKNYCYKLFLEFFKKKDYEMAISYLAKCITADTSTEEYKIHTMLQTYLDMKTIKQGFNKCDYNYDGLDTKELFNQAINNQDYKTAFKNIGKLTYQNDDETLNIMKTILHEMFELERLYGTKIAIPKELKTVKKEVKHEFVNYTIEELLNEVQTGVTETFYNYLKKGYAENKLSRTELTVYRLLYILAYLKEGSLKPADKEYTDESNYLKCFNEAIKYKKIDDIIYYFNKSYEIASNQMDFEIYKILVKDIIRELEKQNAVSEEQEKSLKEEEQTRSSKKELLNINYQIKGVLGNNKETLTMEELDRLYELLKRKKDLEPDETKVEADLLGIIEMLIPNPQIKACDFGSEKEIIVTDYDEGVKELLSVGNYPKAIECMEKASPEQFLSSYSNDNIMIIKTLLLIFNSLVNRKIIVEERQEDPMKLEIKAIASRLKKNDFLGSFNLLLASTHIPSDILSEVAGHVLAVYMAYNHDEETKASDFKQAIQKNPDINEARIALINYKELLDRTSFGELETYQKKYKEMNKLYLRKKL